ncbi:MAG: sugar phosphate isomerase/epimerase [Endomicrobiales bacterium]|nr:sugar phosphate isomerase/epimerase [Endomicrobiales bacterium]
MLSISTAYHLDRNDSWQKLLDDTKRLGFRSLELNVEFPAEWLSDALRSVEKGEIAVSSLHNYCPRLERLPPGKTVYSGYLLSSEDEEERKLAVKYTVNTVECASRLGAKAVVIHAGDVVTEPSGREFAKFVRQFGIKSMLYARYFEEMKASRKKKSARYMNNLFKSLDEVVKSAERAKIVLGIENRYYYHEIPNIEETRQILDRYEGAALAYWHDTGHAEMFVRQGWVKEHVEFLEPFKKRIAGVHLHDVRGFTDHNAPGSGSFDFAILKKYMNPAVIPVIEAHPKASDSEVRGGIKYLTKIGLI